jgi:lysophospholipase L1-like esterase
MQSSKRWRPVAAAIGLALASAALVSSNSVSAEEGTADNHRQKEWVGSWATAVTAAEPTGSARNGFNNQTLRLIVHTSVGGEKVRIRLSNIFGEQTTTIGHATVAKPNTSTPELSDVDPATVRDLTFNGRQSTTMLKGAELLSDPVNLAVRDLEDLVITVFFPVASGPASWHATSQQSSFAGAGDLSTATGGAGFTTRRDCCWYFLSGVDVLRAKTAGSVVVLGDSLGDANGSTLNANTRWPDLLAKRLVTSGHKGKVPGVLNASLAGNRLNHEGPEPGAGGFPGFVQLGTNAGARLNEDVFPQTGAQTVIMDLGINDIWMTGDSAEAIIDSIRKISTQVQERGLRFVACTLGPYEGFALEGAWTPEKEATRNAVNAFLRTSSEFDGLIDFDALLRDPAQPSKLRAEFDSGDHIHPNDVGNQAMADAIPLGLVR